MLTRCKNKGAHKYLSRPNQKQTRNLASFSSSPTSGSHSLVSKQAWCLLSQVPIAVEKLSRYCLPMAQWAKVSFCPGYDFTTTFLHKKIVKTAGIRSLFRNKQESLAIAKMTVWCAQYISALKIVCKHKISRRLHKNRHITILSLFGGEIIFEVFQPIWSGYLNVTDRQTDGRYTEASPHGKTREAKCRRYYRYRRYSKTDHGPSLQVNAHRPTCVQWPKWN